MAQGGDDIPFRAGLELGLCHGLALCGGLSLHAAMFCAWGRQILVLGGTRSGKSTLAAAAIRVKGHVVTDDLGFAVRGSGLGTVLHPLREFLAVRETGKAILESVPGIPLTRFTPGAGDRAWRLSRRHYPQVFADSARPDSLWLTSVDGRRKASAVERVDGAHAAVALIRASTPRFLTARYPKERAALLPVHRALASLPAFRVRLGRRLLEEPEDEMRRLLELTRG